MSEQANEPLIERPPATADTEPQKGIGRLKIPTSALRAYTMVIALVVIWLLFSWATDGIFLSARNFSNLMRQTAVTGVLAVGMLMIIITGQIDLSVGSLVGLAGGVSVMVLTWLGWGLVGSAGAVAAERVRVGAGDLPAAACRAPAHPGRACQGARPPGDLRRGDRRGARPV